MWSPLSVPCPPLYSNPRQLKLPLLPGSARRSRPRRLSQGATRAWPRCVWRRSWRRTHSIALPCSPARRLHWFMRQPRPSVKAFYDAYAGSWRPLGRQQRDCAWEIAMPHSLWQFPTRPAVRGRINRSALLFDSRIARRRAIVLSFSACRRQVCPVAQKRDPEGSRVTKMPPRPADRPVGPFGPQNDAGTF